MSEDVERNRKGVSIGEMHSKQSGCLGIYWEVVRAATVSGITLENTVIVGERQEG